MVQQARIIIADRPPSPRSQDSMAGTHIHQTNDRFALLLPQAPAPYQDQHRVPTRPRVVGHRCLSTWNGISFWLCPGTPVVHNLEVVSDASGAIGYGAFYNQEWFNGRWHDIQSTQSIAYKELFPVILAAHLWGHYWSQQHVLFRSDNEAVVAILNKRTSKVTDLMRLLRSLLHAAAHFSFLFSSEHIPGVHNSIADALSRFNGRSSGVWHHRLDSIRLHYPYNSSKI
jgi:hypothetical protein